MAGGGTLERAHGWLPMPPQVCAVAVEQEAPAAIGSLARQQSHCERTPWADNVFLERASRHQLQAVLRKLQAQGELARQQASAGRLPWARAPCIVDAPPRALARVL